MVEFGQMRNSKTWSQYFRQSKNIIDLLEIIVTLGIGVTCLTYEFDETCKEQQGPWFVNLILMIALVSFFQLITNMAECLPHNDIIQVEKYIHMFYQVVRRCSRLIFGFTPFLMMFAFSFQGYFLEKNRQSITKQLLKILHFSHGK